MSVRLWSIVPGKPMYTSTKEFRPQTQKSCYQKTFWGWHTQYTPSRSPFSGPRDPQIARYLAVTPLSDAMVFYAMGIFRSNLQPWFFIVPLALNGWDQNFSKILYSSQCKNSKLGWDHLFLFQTSVKFQNASLCSTLPLAHFFGLTSHAWPVT